MKAVSLDSPRVRFNWGFHDGTHDKSRKRNRTHITQGKLFCLPQWDKAYCAGYAAGQACDISAGRPDSSDAAWLTYQGEETEKREARKALRDMRPERSFRC